MYLQSSAGPKLYLNAGVYEDAVVLDSRRYGWTVTPQPGGRVVITSRSGAFLGFAPGGLSRRDHVYVGGTPVQWKISPAPGGAVKLVAQRSGKPSTLDVYDPADGPVQLYTGNTSANQRWLMGPMEVEPEAVPVVAASPFLQTKVQVIKALVDYIDKTPGYKENRRALTFWLKDKDFREVLGLLPEVARESRLPTAGHIQMPGAHQGTLWIDQGTQWERFISLLRIIFKHSIHHEFPADRWAIKHHGMAPHSSLGRPIQEGPEFPGPGGLVTFTMKDRVEFFQQDRANGYNVAVQPYWITLPIIPERSKIRNCPYGCHISLAFLWHS